MFYDFERVCPYFRCFLRWVVNLLLNVFDEKNVQKSPLYPKNSRTLEQNHVSC